MDKFSRSYKIADSGFSRGTVDSPEKLWKYIDSAIYGYCEDTMTEEDEDIWRKYCAKHGKPADGVRWTGD